MKNNKTELLVAALENGTVIDHIPFRARVYHRFTA